MEGKEPVPGNLPSQQVFQQPVQEFAQNAYDNTPFHVDLPGYIPFGGPQTAPEAPMGDAPLELPANFEVKEPEGRTAESYGTFGPVIMNQRVTLKKVQPWEQLPSEKDLQHYRNAKRQELPAALAPSPYLASPMQVKQYKAPPAARKARKRKVKQHSSLVGDDDESDSASTRAYEEAEERRKANNRQAAKKCREKKTATELQLKKTCATLQQDNQHLAAEVERQKGEIMYLFELISAHRHCNDPRIDAYMAKRAERITQMVSAPPPPSLDPTLGLENVRFGDGSLDGGQFNFAQPALGLPYASGSGGSRVQGQGQGFLHPYGTPHSSGLAQPRTQTQDSSFGQGTYYSHAKGPRPSPFLQSANTAPPKLPYESYFDGESRRRQKEEYESDMRALLQQDGGSLSSAPMSASTSRTSGRNNMVQTPGGQQNNNSDMMPPPSTFQGHQPPSDQLANPLLGPAVPSSSGMQQPPPLVANALYQGGGDGGDMGQMMAQQQQQHPGQFGGMLPPPDGGEPQGMDYVVDDDSGNAEGYQVGDGQGQGDGHRDGSGNGGGNDFDFSHFSTPFLNNSDGYQTPGNLDTGLDDTDMENSN